ncbi:hypothetical protein ORJ66_10450 [Pseudoalteromonas tunicata]|uniref:hypothetical protein n=1 Tax=Pseudoalteromonas tunicata TaxID=314281 RepID=UPI00273FCA7B|nr:hypothetical protein [Pseudoalteromonas tunicata]MDP5213461.1 hypothetical protein [Pseudoalteromonas tunicata]
MIDLFFTLMEFLNMIHKNDIELFLKAKRQLKIRRNILILCIVSLITWIALRFIGISHTYLDFVVLAVFLGGLVNADGGAFFAFIPKSKLLDIIERQINKDPEAIKYIAKKQK